jgi:hypothetical protein
MVKLRQPGSSAYHQLNSLGMVMAYNMKILVIVERITGAVILCYNHERRVQGNMHSNYIQPAPALEYRTCTR